jgi:hypothetical protein
MILEASMRLRGDTSALLSGKAGSHYFHDGARQPLARTGHTARGPAPERSRAKRHRMVSPSSKALTAHTRRETLRNLNIAAVSLVIIGGINWGLVALADFRSGGEAHRPEKRPDQ